LTHASRRILVINPGSTSTKFGIYTDQGAELVRSIRHGDEELTLFQGLPMVARQGYRARLLKGALEEAGYSETGFGEERFAAVVGRGGLLPPMSCGTYLVDDAMVEELRLARRGEHACNLGALLALHFARAAGVNAYIVDPVVVDEWQPCARLSGTPLLERECTGHALNIKAVARRFAGEQGRKYADLRRTGGLPARALAKLCYSGRFVQKEMDRRIFGDGGLFAYLGTRDLQEVEQRIDSGDAKAAQVLEAMIYQIAKEAGSMAAVLEGKVDALLLTGGMAYSERMVAALGRYLQWIAPIKVYPGEDELQALAEGVFRVLNGEEKAKRLWEEGRNPQPAAATREPLKIGME
jgi:butyrate kinase